MSSNWLSQISAVSNQMTLKLCPKLLMRSKAIGRTIRICLHRWTCSTSAATFWRIERIQWRSQWWVTSYPKPWSIRISKRVPSVVTRWRKVLSVSSAGIISKIHPTWKRKARNLRNRKKASTLSQRLKMKKLKRSLKLANIENQQTSTTNRFKHLPIQTQKNT